MTVEKKRRSITTETGTRETVRTVQRDKILSMLIAGERVKTIAKKVKVKPITIYKWMKEPEFAVKLEESMGVMKAATLQAMCELVTPCFDAIQEQIEEGDGRLAFDLLKELGALRSVGTAAGFENSDKTSGLNITINVSGHKKSEIPENTEKNKVIDVETVDD